LHPEIRGGRAYRIFALLTSPIERIGIAASFVAATLPALAIQCCSRGLTHRRR
jgi:hypothetical protein